MSILFILPPPQSGFQNQTMQEEAVDGSWGTTQSLSSSPTGTQIDYPATFLSVSVLSICQSLTHTHTHNEMKTMTFKTLVEHFT